MPDLHSYGVLITVDAPSDAEIIRMLESYTNPGGGLTLRRHVLMASLMASESARDSSINDMMGPCRTRKHTLTYDHALERSTAHLEQLGRHGRVPAAEPLLTADGTAESLASNLARALTGWSERRTLRQLVDASNEIANHLMNKRSGLEQYLGFT
jgi:hypothetical protein